VFIYPYEIDGVQSGALVLCEAVLLLDIHFFPEIFNIFFERRVSRTSIFSCRIA